MALQVFYDQYATLPIVPTPSDCAGKTFIVTGANTGLGFECAKHLVRLCSGRVIIASRSLSNGEAAKAIIEAETGNKGIAEVWALDLGSYDSVKAFAKKVQGLDRLDAIIENAGIALDKWSTHEGLETTLTVNVVGTFLLAALVFPKLKESAKKFGGPTRLTIIGSATAFWANGMLEKIDGDILDEMSIEKSGMKNRYPVSKLMQLYAVRQLASLNPTSETGVIINYVNPGLCYSGLTRHVGWLGRQGANLMCAVLARSTEAGSRTHLHAAFSGEESHGKYLSECTVKDHYIPEWMTNESGKRTQQRVWESLTKKLNETQPGCI